MGRASALAHKLRVGLLLVVLCAATGGCASVKSALSGRAEARLSETEKAAIRQACEDISEQYAHYLDTKDYEGMPNAFAPDGVWEVLGNKMVGSEEIREYWKRRTATWKPTEGWHHQISNQVIEVIDRDHARGVSYFVVYRFDTRPGGNKALTPAVITRSSDEYVRTPEGWRLKRRSIERLADAAR